MPDGPEPSDVVLREHYLQDADEDRIVVDSPPVTEGTDKSAYSPEEETKEQHNNTCILGNIDLRLLHAGHSVHRLFLKPLVVVIS